MNTHLHYKEEDSAENLIDKLMNEKEAVNHPDHYNVNGIEVIDVIDAYGLDFSLGNAIKYILRSGRKDKKKTVEDLKKAIWYIEHYIQLLNK